MSFCRFSEGAAMFAVTPIENMFLLEYLPSAPDGFLRVYLYARMLCLHPELGSGIEEMAAALQMEVDAVYNAFHYWEQQGLVEKLSDRPATYAMLPLHGDRGVSEMDRSYYTYRDFNASLQNIFGEGELLNPKQYNMAMDWLNILGFSQSAVLRLVEYEKKQNGSPRPAAVFRRADKRAIEWAEKGIRSLEEVEKAIASDDSVNSMLRMVMQQLSLSRKPTANELDCVRKWVHEWNLTREDVLSACADTTKSRNPSIGYLDAILKTRRESGEDGGFEAAKLVLRELGAANNVPTPDQVRAYNGLLERGFEAGAILLAAVQCARKHKHGFEDLEWMLGKWADAGVRSREQAERYVNDMQQATLEVRALLESAGLSRRPNMDDLERYESWKKRFSVELIRCAAECAKGARVPMKYMEKLLSEWEKSAITTPEAARAQHAAATGREKTSADMNYQQHSYREEDFGDDFYFDPTRGFGTGGDNK